MWFRAGLPIIITCSLLTYAASSNASPSDSSNAIPFSPGFDIRAVISLATSLPSHSWEFGTASEALLELYDPQYAVFGSSPFPVPTVPPSQSASLDYAQEKIVIGTGANGLSDGDGAVGDPASLGVSAVMLGMTDSKYSIAAKEEVEFILGQAPRWWNGAISHRVQYAELWADFIYMAPPFLAYYGVATNNASVLRASVEQCRLYRQALLANTTWGIYSPPTSHPDIASGLWEHIVGPVNADPGVWSTGNAWAAAGMTRVLATVLKAPPKLYKDRPTSASDLSVSWKNKAVDDLTAFIREILDATMQMPMDGGLLLNYLDDNRWFGEISGSALMASVAYRLSVLAPSLGIRNSDVHNYAQWAEDIRYVFGQGHVTSNGTATPAVNPLGWGDQQPWTAGSPEGQNFVVMMYAAWRDCVNAGVRGCNA